MTAFEFPIRIYWEDTDAGGIVFYANYLKYFERARTEWLRSLGWGQQHLRETVGGMFVVTNVQLQYHRPARLDDLLLVSARVSECRAATLTLHQQAHLQPANAQPTDTQAHPDDAALLCQGQVRLGWVDAATLCPARIPSFVLEHLA